MTLLCYAHFKNLMKKLFMQLVAEFKRLGCNIIYANFNKIILCSKKRTIADAIANAEFVIASIRNKELFHSLQISCSRCWEQLVWLDPANYGGICGKILPHLADKTGDSQENGTLLIQESFADNSESNDEPTVVMTWNLIEQLSEAFGCRSSFTAIIAGYIKAIYFKLCETEIAEDAVVAFSQLSLGLASHSDVAEYAKELISGEISQNLFRITERLVNHLPVRKETNSNPALDFVNAICHILDLDPAVQDEVYKLKCNLLRIVGIGEFSDKANWKDRTVSHVVSQLICKGCNHCRDVDLGRDSHRSEHAWLCPLCNASYDNAEIEALLLETISRRFLSYNLQDLQCKKCSQIKMENLMKHCQCAGEFQGLIAKENFIKLLETFKGLGDTFNMPVLYETVNDILQLII